MKSFLRSLFAGSFTLLSLACAGNQDGTEEAVTKSTSNEEAKPAAGDSPSGAAAPEGVKVAPVVDADCIDVPALKSGIPFFVASERLMITRLVTGCTTANGGVGLKPKSPWLVMGFPCTGGGGRIDIRGKYQNPNLVSFVVGTECSMAPAAKDHVHDKVAAAVGLPKDAPLMAYLPFVVQYWELIGQRDADTGFSVELRSPQAIESVWRHFREGQGFAVHLYGRENSWVPGGHFYQVEAMLQPEGRNTFKMTVQTAKMLKPDEIAKVKARCEMIKPSRNCVAVF